MTIDQKGEIWIPNSIILGSVVYPDSVGSGTISWIPILNYLFWLVGGLFLEKLY